MANKYLPDGDHMVRHVPFHHLIRQKLVGIFPQTFELREGEAYLSASWLEHFDGTKQERLKATAAAMSAARTILADHGFTVGNVGEVKDACDLHDVRIRVLHEPKGNPNPAYTAVRQFRSDNLELLELLAAEAWADVVEAGEYLPEKKG